MEKYKNGYKEKIKYWAAKYSEAVNNNHHYDMQTSLKKLTYFTEKHVNWIIVHL